MNILSFKLGDDLFGIDLKNVKEINRNIEYTKVPRASDNIVGLFNMRGQVVTLFNLARIFGYDNKVKEGKVTCIILDSQEGSLEHRGFIIDLSGDVVEVAEDMWELPPANISTQENKNIKAVVHFENEILRIIDPNIFWIG